MTAIGAGAWAWVSYVEFRKYLDRRNYSPVTIKYVLPESVGPVYFSMRQNSESMPENLKN